MGKRWERRRRRLVHRLSEAGPIGGGLAVLLSLGKARNSACEDVFAETALAVGGVVLRVSSREEADRVDRRGGAAGFPGTQTIRELRVHYGKDRLR